MPFADEFINAFLAGQQAKENKQLHEQRQRQLQYQAEDRDIETKLLRHRLSEMKLQERLQAREAAGQNLKALSGMHVEDVPSGNLEEAPPPAYQGGGLADQIGNPGFRMKPVTIPGISGDMLGGIDIPDVQVRPDTAEGQLADLLAQSRIKAMTTLHPIAYGGGLANGLGETLLAPQKRPEPMVDVETGRDKNGVVTRQTMTTSQAAALGQRTMQPLPRRPSSTQTASQEEIDSKIAAILAGRQSADLTGIASAPRLKIENGLEKAKFNVRLARSDERALATHFQTLNGSEVAKLQLAANNVNGALDDLDNINSTWDRNTFGPFTWASIALTKAQGGPAADKAKDAEEAIRAVAEGLAVLKAGGGAPTNQALADAEKVLSNTQGKEDLAATIQRVKRSVAYRTGAINNLSAILPSGGGGTAVTAPGPAAANPDPLGILGGR